MGNATTTPAATSSIGPGSTSTVVSFRVPTALYTEFKKLADHEYDTVANRIRMLMREDVRRNRKTRP